MKESKKPGEKKDLAMKNLTKRIKAKQIGKASSTGKKTFQEMLKGAQKVIKEVYGDVSGKEVLPSKSQITDPLYAEFDHYIGTQSIKQMQKEAESYRLPGKTTSSPLGGRDHSMGKLQIIESDTVGKEITATESSTRHMEINPTPTQHVQIIESDTIGKEITATETSTRHMEINPAPTQHVQIIESDTIGKEISIGETSTRHMQMTTPDKHIEKHVDIEENEDELEEDDENDEEDDEYLFPDPEELTTTNEPHVGMVFHTLKDAKRFVNVYGQKEGFAVIIGRNYKNQKYTLVCTKARKPKGIEKVQRKRKRKQVQRSDCQMNIIVKLRNGMWEFTSVQMQHNHPLVSTPSLTRFFLSHTEMTDEERDLSRVLREVRLKPLKIMAVFRKLRGKLKNVPFKKKAIENLQQADDREKVNKDIEYTLKYLKTLQLNKPGFCYTMETDEENCVRSIFWTDAKGRLDYKLCGEFMVFDTTFSTNRYNMLFAPFVGVNCHGKTIVFAWVLLKDQTAATFKWAFSTYLETMGGKAPEIIMTDQDKAMKSAISHVFPLAKHRLCIWHIMRNARERLGGYMSEREGMEKELMTCVYQTLTVEEFESQWNSMLQKYDDKENDHLKRMWKHRENWIPAYFMDQFCPFTKTTGRSESTNSVFKDYVRRQDTIETFMKQYEHYEETVDNTEDMDRFDSIENIPVYSTRDPIERHAAKLYTRGLYLKFLEELFNSNAYSVDEVEKGETYVVERQVYYETPEFYRKRFTVHVDMEKREFDCMCKKYNRHGLLCCHVIRLFKQLNIYDIPERYIMKRWTKLHKEDVLGEHKRKLAATIGTDPSQNEVRYALMMRQCSDICSDLCKDVAKSNAFIEMARGMRNMNIGPDTESTGTDKLKDPPVSSAKFVNKGNRLLRQSEMSRKKGNNQNQEQRADVVPQHDDDYI